MGSWHLLAAAILLTAFLMLQVDHSDATASNASTRTKKSVKKSEAPASHVLPTAPMKAEQSPSDDSDQVVVISERPQQQDAPVNSKSTGKQPSEDVKFVPSSAEIPDTYAAVFYVLVGITSSAIVLLLVRIYRLRLSRAERKYGVQGDRANQELTPLPMAIEDVNSDEEDDHTLFEVNRQSIRIL